MQYCSNCGFEIRSTGNFCPNCGARVNQPAAAPPPTVPAPSSGETEVLPETAAAQQAAAPQPAQPPAPAQQVPPAPQAPQQQGAQNAYVSPPPGAAKTVPYGAPVPPGAAPAVPGGSATRALGDLLNRRYLVLRKLSEGGMGAVYVAEDTTLANRVCAVKEMLPYYTTPQEKEDAERLFLREVKMLATLRHPGIPQIYDYFIELDHYYYVMEFIEGENLEDRAATRGGRLPEREVIEFARQMADILDYLSSRPEPVIHRDIKPANLILDKTTNTVKLVDFGLAKADAATTVQKKSAALGTRGYAPPEQYQGRSEPKSDIYALGATLHHMLSGEDPANAPALFQFTPLRRALPGISPALEALVMRMVETNIANRPSAADVKAVLAGAPAPSGMGGMPVGAVPPGGVISQGGIPPAGVPFTFRSGAFSRSVDELAQNCERFWQDGVFHLYNGQLEPWLIAQGRQDLASASLAIRQRTPDRSAGLEEFLHLLNPALKSPNLKLLTPSFDLATKAKGERIPIEVELSNDSRGYLYGAAASLAPWITLRDPRIGVGPGAKQLLHGEVNTGALNEGALQAPAVELRTNGGSAVIPIQLNLVWPPKLGITPASLDFGDVLIEEHGRQVSQAVTVRNDGGGTLTVQIFPLEQWIAVSTTALTLASGQSAVVQVFANSSAIPALHSVEGQIVFQSNAGVTPLKTRLGVKKALYDWQPRLMRWGAYLGLMAFAWWMFSFVVASLPAWVFSGRAPFDTLPEWLRAPLWEGVLDIVAPNLPDLVPYISDMLSVIFLVAVLVPALAAVLFSGRFIRELDEIENYHSSGKLAALPAAAQPVASWRLWAALAAALSVTLIFSLLDSGYAVSASDLGVAARMGMGLAAGAALAFSVVAPGMKPGFLRRAGAMLALAVFGWMITMTWESQRTPVIWVFLAMLLTIDLTGVMPQRARWVLSYARPALMIGFLVWLGVTTARSIIGIVPSGLPVLYFGYGSVSLLFTFYALFWLAGGLGMLFLAVRVEQPQYAPVQGVPRVYWTALVIFTLVGMVVFGVMRIPLSVIHSAAAGWLGLIFTTAGCAAAAMLMIGRKARVQAALLSAAQALSGPASRVALPRQIDGARTAFGRWFTRALGPAPIDPLTDDIAARALAAALVLVPVLVYLLFSSLWLAGCLLAVLVPIGLIVFLAIYLSKKNSP